MNHLNKSHLFMSIIIYLISLHSQSHSLLNLYLTNIIDLGNNYICCGENDSITSR